MKLIETANPSAFVEEGVIRNHFAVDPGFESRLAFPCCVCLHRNGSDRDEPCCRCENNLIAEEIMRKKAQS